MALAKKTGAIVASAETRHAPEHRFPASHDDTFAAYQWVLQNAQRFGGDPRRVAIAGESAGGNTAVHVAIQAREQRVQPPRHVLLVYPIAGTNLDTPSYRRNEHAVPLSNAAMEWFVRNTISSPSDLQDARLDIIGAANLTGPAASHNHQCRDRPAGVGRVAVGAEASCRRRRDHPSPLRRRDARVLRHGRRGGGRRQGPGCRGTRLARRTGYLVPAGPFGAATRETVDRIRERPRRVCEAAPRVTR